jgi:hypothetical protein
LVKPRALKKSIFFLSFLYQSLQNFFLFKKKHFNRTIEKDSNLQKFNDLTREGQMKAIESTFVSANKVSLNNLKHPTHPELKATELFPIFPDFEFWPNAYNLVSFDGDPISIETLASKDEKHLLKLQESIMKPMQLPDDPTSSWFAYFAPSENAMNQIVEKRKRLAELSEDEELVDEQVVYFFFFFYKKKQVFFKQSSTAIRVPIY